MVEGKPALSWAHWAKNESDEGHFDILNLSAVPVLNNDRVRDMPDKVFKIEDAGRDNSGAGGSSSGIINPQIVSSTIPFTFTPFCACHAFTAASVAGRKSHPGPALILFEALLTSAPDDRFLVALCFVLLIITCLFG